jgi:hypothetical protein
MTDTTLTIRRANQDITVAVRYRPKHGRWTIKEAVDEDGNPVSLDMAEQLSICERAKAGEDETGR